MSSVVVVLLLLLGFSKANSSPTKKTLETFWMISGRRNLHLHLYLLSVITV